MGIKKIARDFGLSKEKNSNIVKTTRFLYDSKAQKRQGKEPRERTGRLTPVSKTLFIKKQRAKFFIPKYSKNKNLME